MYYTHNYTFGITCYVYTRIAHCRMTHVQKKRKFCEMKLPVIDI